jgi:hypothetical protein
VQHSPARAPDSDAGGVSGAATNTRTQLLDRTGRPLLEAEGHDGIFIADASLARHTALGNTMSLAAFCGYVSARRSMDRGVGLSRA